MNPPVLTQFAAPDPNASPLTVAQLVSLLNVLVSSEIQGSYLPYVIGSDQPGAGDQDKVWIELDSQNRPIALKTYWHGHWRRVYNGMLGEIRIYSGDPSIDFDNNGLGKVGQTYDGWHICNGKNGVIDLSDRFVIGAHMNGNDGINGFKDGEWITTEVKTAGEHSGGFREITLNEANTYQPAVDIGTLVVGKYQDNGNTMYLTTDGIVYGVPSVQDENKNTTLKIQSTGVTQPEAINIINPFLAFAYIIFVGYAT